MGDSPLAGSRPVGGRLRTLRRRVGTVGDVRPYAELVERALAPTPAELAHVLLPRLREKWLTPASAATERLLSLDTENAEHFSVRMKLTPLRTSRWNGTCGAEGVRVPAKLEMGSGQVV